MTDHLHFDESTSRAVEAAYTTPDLVMQRRRVLEALAPRPGEHILDVGCGPGFLVREMAEIVGPGGAVTGLDNSASMLALAHRRCDALANITLAEGDALALPFEDESFHAATVTQVYEYVADIDRALAELRRILRPGGRALILDTDWSSIVWRTSDDGRAQRILHAWDEHLAHPHLPRTLPDRLERAGLTVCARSDFPIVNTACGPDTFSGGLIGFITAFTPGRQGVTKEEADAWAADLRARSDAGDYAFSLTRSVVVAARG